MLELGIAVEPFDGFARRRHRRPRAPARFVTMPSELPFDELPFVWPYWWIPCCGLLRRW